MAYDARLHPVARRQLKDIALTINEVAFISMEVGQSIRQHEHPVRVACTTMRTSANEHCCGQACTLSQQNAVNSTATEIQAVQDQHYEMPCACRFTKLCPTASATSLQTKMSKQLQMRQPWRTLPNKFLNLPCITVSRQDSASSSLQKSKTQFCQMQVLRNHHETTSHGHCMYLLQLLVSP